MTTLVISNQGLIESGDLTLIGSSTKRGVDGKIGMYGSGNKYALAWFLRNNIDIRIFSGKQEIVLSHEIVKHRQNNVAVLTVDGKLTSITSEMGPEWTSWMALREIISNAIDEGNHTISTAFNVEPQGLDDDCTTIHIPLNNELNTVIRNYDYYFSFDRKCQDSNNVGKVFIKTEKSLQNIYRKGIKCYDEKEKLTHLDFDFNSIEISESRVCSYYDKNRRITQLLSEGVASHILKLAILDNLELPYLNDNIKANLIELCKTESFTTKSIEKLSLFISIPENALVIPELWYEWLTKEKYIKSVFSNEDIKFIETFEKNPSNIKHLLATLGIFDVEIQFGKFTSFGNMLTNDTKTAFFIKDDLQISDKQIAVDIIKAMPSLYLIDKLFS